MHPGICGALIFDERGFSFRIQTQYCAVSCRLPKFAQDPIGNRTIYATSALLAGNRRERCSYTKLGVVDDTKSGRLIYPTDLVNRHCLSFTDQPYLKNLVRDIRSSVPLTLIIGAGVSMESGLPSWSELVGRLIQNISDPDLQKHVSRAPIELTRRAELAIALLDQDDADLQILIRDALYPAASLTQPGQLAHAIARLVVKRHSEIRIITTNYDPLLERAIELYQSHPVRSFSMEDIEGWKKENSERRPAVLHVHGLVPQDGEAAGEVVLSESQFLAAGEKVQTVIAESLTDSMALTIGLSLTDPNVVGPLYRTSSKDNTFPRYSLSVVPSPTGTVGEKLTAAKFHVESARFLERMTMKPILLKSYSQLNQAVSDLSLAIAEPQRYSGRPPKGTKSLLYGKRFNRALEALYSELGSSRPPYVPTGESAAEITQRLRNALESPEKFLHEKTGEYGIASSIKGQEHFQLCLWLRRADGVDGRPNYAIELFGSSTFQNYDSWALRRDVPIEIESPYAAAQAVFRGLSVSTNLDPNLNGALWKGVLAIPIMLGFTDTAFEGTPLDQLTVGALTLDSTHCVTELDNNGNKVIEHNLGIIGRLRKRDTDGLINLLYDAVPTILFSDRT